MPRIIAGSARGIPLQVPKGSLTRPTGDKVKEALFSMLMPRLQQASFLDLFAGTGQIGLEAASRGADHVVLVEQSSESLACIQANIAKTRLEAKVTVMRGAVARQLQQLIRQEAQFDLIFMDPPWKEALKDLSSLADLIVKLLKPDGLLVFEHESREQAPAFVTQLQLSRSCQYGAAMISFYHMKQIDS